MNKSHVSTALPGQGSVRDPRNRLGGHAGFKTGLARCAEFLLESIATWSFCYVVHGDQRISFD